MPEAVIVATARSPDRPGRPGLAGQHPSGRPGHPDGPCRARPGAGTRSARPRRPDIGCGQPGGEQGFNVARTVAVQLGYDFLPGTTVNRYCSSSLQTTRMAFHAIKAGEGDVSSPPVSRRCPASSRAAPTASPDSHNPLYADAEARTIKASQSPAPATGTTRARTAPLPDVYIAMGQTAENVALLRDVSREDMDHFGVRSQNRPSSHRERLLGQATSPRSRCRTAPSSPTMTAPVRASPTRRCPSSSRSSARTER